MSAADAVRVQQARAALKSFPSDADLARMPATELVTWVVRMQGAAHLLDAYVRDAEADDARCLREIRGLLARFDWEHDDRQLALEAIDRIADGAQRGAVTLTAKQAAMAARALADAEGYRRLRADQWCSDCETAPEGACEDHVNDLDLADAYRDLAAELGEGSGDGQ
ncbi:MAG: hypothetical protein ACRDPY_28405 [Streptosporangiaceae bacterium]